MVNNEAYIGRDSIASPGHVSVGTNQYKLFLVERCRPWIINVVTLQRHAGSLRRNGERASIALRVEPQQRESGAEKIEDRLVPRISASPSLIRPAARELMRAEPLRPDAVERLEQRTTNCR